MATITIVDPVTRIEGHLKVEVTIDDVGGVQQVIDAKCSGTLFRGFETDTSGTRSAGRPEPYPTHLRRLPRIARYGVNQGAGKTQQD